MSNSNADTGRWKAVVRRIRKVRFVVTCLPPDDVDGCMMLPSCLMLRPDQCCIPVDEKSWLAQSRTK